MAGVSAYAQNSGQSSDQNSGQTAGPKGAGPQDSEASAEAETPLSEEALDGLFNRLAGSEDETEAKAVEFELLKRFHRSGSDTIDAGTNAPRFIISKAITASRLPILRRCFPFNRGISVPCPGLD